MTTTFRNMAVKLSKSSSTSASFANSLTVFGASPGLPNTWNNLVSIPMRTAVCCRGWYQKETISDDMGGVASKDRVRQTSLKARLATLSCGVSSEFTNALAADKAANLLFSVTVPALVPATCMNNSCRLVEDIVGVLQ
jgi:hypothetical protein